MELGRAHTIVCQECKLRAILSGIESIVHVHHSSHEATAMSEHVLLTEAGWIYRRGSSLSNEGW